MFFGILLSPEEKLEVYEAAKRYAAKHTEEWGRQQRLKSQSLFEQAKLNKTQN